MRAWYGDPLLGWVVGETVGAIEAQREKSRVIDSRLSRAPAAQVT